jgi:hypothetical protein
LKTIAWTVFGFGMLYVVYSEYVSWVTTGIVEARREGVGFAGDGAVALLVGYLGLALFFFLVAYTEWRKRK